LNLINDDKQICDYCKESDFVWLYEVKEYIFGVDYFNICKCAKCGLYQTYPRPSIDKLANYYPDVYSPYNLNTYISLFSPGKSMVAEVKNRIKRIYIKSYFNYYAETTQNKFARSALKILTWPVKIRTEWIFPEYKERGRVLDIGCSTGFYLSRLKELGWDTYGVETSKYAFNIASKHFNGNVRYGNLESAEFNADYFDAVTMWQVLEHVESPLSTLLEVKRILKKGGVLIIGVPNVSTCEVSIFGKWWWAWEVPRHLNHFTPEVIRNCLEKTGLKLLKVEFSSNPNNIIMSVQRVLIDCFPKYQDGIKRFIDPDKNKYLWYLVFPMSFLLLVLGKSGRMIVYAKK